MGWYNKKIWFLFFEKTIRNRKYLKFITIKFQFKIIKYIDTKRNKIKNYVNITK